MQNLLAKTLQTAGARLYQNRWFSRPVDIAQDQLMGRTHYADPDTLRYFRARVSYAAPILDGAFFLLIESSSQDPDHTRRGFRCVLFDVFGEVVYRPDMEAMQTSSDRARKDFDAWRESFDPVAYYAQKLAERLARKERELRDLQQATAAVQAAHLAAELAA